MNDPQLFKGEALDVLRTMADNSADGLITDPPYSSGGSFRGDRNSNVRTKYQNTETKKQYPDFSGDARDQQSYFYWVCLWLGQCMRVVSNGGPFCIFTDWRQLSTTINAVQVAGLVYRGIVPWNKTESSRPAKGRFRAQCEYVVWGSFGPMDEQSEEYMPGFFTYRVNPAEKEHVTAKPLALMKDILKIVKPGGVVLDPFMGSGTTGEAAIAGGYGFIGIEQEHQYFEIARRKIYKAAGKTVIKPGQMNQTTFFGQIG